MNETPTHAPAHEAVAGGGPASAADALASDPVRQAAARLGLLSPDARENVLSRMDPEIAQRVRDQIASSTEQPLDERRRMIREMAERVSARKVAQVDSMTSQLAAGSSVGDTAATVQQPVAPSLGQPVAPPSAVAPAATIDGTLAQLREVHPAAIARAMQGERAEAWAIVLDRLETNARAALQLYLDAGARAAIDEARVRQNELATSSPALLATVEAAVARSVVPRAMREHHQLLSTTPMAWSATPA